MNLRALHTAQRNKSDDEIDMVIWTTPTEWLSKGQPFFIRCCFHEWMNVPELWCGEWLYLMF